MAVLLANAASALVLTGVIWVVQLVLYPLFSQVGTGRWGAYHGQHTRRIGWVVVPAMAVELASSVALPFVRPAGVAAWMPVAALALTLLALGMTGVFGTADHGRLSRGYDQRIVRRLIDVGWVRTAAWSAHGVLALAMLAAA